MAASTHSVDESIGDAIIVIDELGEGEASFLGQRVFQGRITQRHVGWE